MANNANDTKSKTTPEDMEKLGYKIYPPVLPAYAGMISQEHAETVVKLLAEKSVDFHVSLIGCTPTTIAIYAKFESVEKQKNFEADITPYQIIQWS